MIKLNTMTQKELKEQYKQMKFKMGVFQIRNIANDKIYVDCSTNLDAIRNRNWTELNFGGHRSPELQKDWNDAGEGNFVFEILAEIEPEDGKNTDYKKEINALLELYLEELQPFGNKGYNRPPKKSE